MKQKSHFAALLTLALCIQVFAQQPATPAQQTLQPTTPTSSPKDDDETVRITTNVVQLDFVVTDKRGNQVTDLKADDIEVFEDGRAQKVTNFSYISTEPVNATTGEGTGARNPAERSALSPPAERVRRDHVRRTIAIVVDDLGMSFQSLVPARLALRRFVEQQVQAGDLVAIVRTGGEVGALQQFSHDKRQLLAAIERLRWNPCSRRGIYTTPPLRQDALSYDNLLNGTRGGTLPPGSFPPCGFNLGATLESIRFIIGGMRELPGRKSVVIFSDSIPDEAGPGEATPSMSVNYAAFANAAGTDRRSYRDPLRLISELAIRASVVIYSVDTRGLTALNFSATDDITGLSEVQLSKVRDDRSGDMIAGRRGTESMAHQTGGFVVKNNNDISLGLRRIMNDLRGYYLVGYRPNSETFNKRFHTIKARVRNRPDLSVRSRTGFFGIPEEEAPAKATTAADRFMLALTSPFGAGDIDVQLTPTFTNETSTGSFLRTMLHINTRGLTFKREANGWQSTDLVLRGVIFGDNGKIVNEHRRQFTLRLRGATLKRIQSRGLNYVFNMPVKKPGAYQFRIAVLDPISGRIGSAGQFVEVPDLKKKRLALSGLIVRGLVAANAVGVPAKSITSAADGASDLQNNEATPAVRRFQQQMLLDYTYVVFNARIDKSAARPELSVRTQFFRDGQLVYDREIPAEVAMQIDPTRAIVSGRLQLGQEFLPGDYVLQITITDPLAPREHQKATQSIDFEIIK